jgi:hypothetical protein
MKTKNFISRLMHAKSRPSDAINRIISRSILRLLGIDLSLETEIQYVELGNFNSQISRKELLHDNCFVSFRKNSKEFQHSFDPRYLVEITNVIVNTSTNHIYVLDSDSKRRYLLRESTNWPVQLEILNNKLPRRMPKSSFTGVTLGIPKSGFYHWITEDLPNLMRTSGPSQVLCFEENSKSIIDLYEELRFNSRLVEKWVYVEKLLFYTKGQDLGYLHPADAKVLKDFAEGFSDEDCEKGQKIYVSRRKSRRSLPAEEEIEKYLVTQGFQVMYAEDHSIVDQIKIFKNASVIIGVHGAGLTNSVWSTNCKLIEIMPQNRINRCFEWQANICGQEYHCIYYDEENFSFQSVISDLKDLIV